MVPRNAMGGSQGQYSRFPVVAPNRYIAGPQKGKYSRDVTMSWEPSVFPLGSSASS